MNDSKFKVLLYSDGSHQAFSAAVYTASLLKSMPDMHLTIVQLQESNEGFMGTEYSWKELRPKYKRFYWGCSTGTEYSWKDTWPTSPNSDWMKRVLDKSDLETQDRYDEILTKTNEIFSRRGLTVNYQVLCTNIDISDTSDTVDALLAYATKNSFKLIIMGTRGFSTLKGLVFGCLGHRMLNKSPIPVLLIKKLSKDFIDNYLSDTESEISSGIPLMTNGRTLNILF